MLRVFSAPDLPLILPWFAHPDQREFAHDLPARELKLQRTLPGSEYRGAQVLARHSWISEDEAGIPVAFVGAETYDRPPCLDSKGERTQPAPTWRGPTAGIMICVDPTRWGLGHGRAALLAVAAADELASVEWLVAGIDAGHLASQRCAVAAGFASVTAQPDEENMLTFIRKAIRDP